MFIVIESSVIYLRLEKFPRKPDRMKITAAHKSHTTSNFDISIPNFDVSLYRP